MDCSLDYNCNNTFHYILLYFVGKFFFLTHWRNGYPKQVAAETILRSINSYCRELKTPSSMKEIRFVLYDSESVGVYMSELGKLDTSF
jgi:hypothetical protein